MKALNVIIICFISSLLSAQKPENEPENIPLREGLVVLSVDGIIKESSSDVWSFYPKTDIADDRTKIQADEPIELLPCSTLEKIIASKEKEEESIMLRLSARITKYKGKNYLYPFYFIPIEKKIAPSNQNNEIQESSAVDPEDKNIIPKEIYEALKNRSEVNLKRIRSSVDSYKDVMMVNRTGYLKTIDGKLTFEINAFGRKVDGMNLIILRNNCMMDTEEILKKTASNVRFRAAGIVTKYQDKYYLLLQRAVRTYSHGNFVR